jgi:tRNA A37 threonylcarbamoyladenosine dehydratase
MSLQFSRTELIFGKEAMKILAGSRVAVFGIGGVGGYVVEALARSGVGALDIIDNDKISLTNLNRQVFALHSTVGKYKVDVAEERIHDISPDIVVSKHKCFFMPDTAEQFDFTKYNYVVDAIDTVSGKIEIIMRASAAGVPVISSMGAGNKIDPTKFRVADIYDTRVCPLARVMRYELKKRGIRKLKVVYSEEEPLSPVKDGGASCLEDTDNPSEPASGAARRSVPGSNAFVPSVAGLIIAGEVICDLAGIRKK